VAKTVQEKEGKAEAYSYYIAYMRENKLIVGGSVKKVE